MLRLLFGFAQEETSDCDNDSSRPQQTSRKDETIEKFEWEKKREGLLYLFQSAASRILGWSSAFVHASMVSPVCHPSNVNVMQLSGVHRDVAMPWQYEVVWFAKHALTIECAMAVCERLFVDSITTTADAQ